MKELAVMLAVGVVTRALGRGQPLPSIPVELATAVLKRRVNRNECRKKPKPRHKTGSPLP